MKLKNILTFVLTLGISVSNVYANPKYQKTDSETLKKIKEITTFKLLLPAKIPSNWTLEIKYPYPLEITKPITKVRLHYFDKDESYMLGIEQFKASGYVTKEEIRIDPTGNQIHQLTAEKFLPDLSGEILYVNGHQGRFMPTQPKGGDLWWIENDTFIRMNSLILTKEEMLKIAIVMK
ncbi:hypothetical protein SAMN03159341_1282 [Paenibacillus sp. 1_12]|uniref:hypothetical protein n=1 Tax=Paenibacillus sp. 1_12 TaxID=1566278 RepID=UPI0008E282E9|nr:hypothetical protein [Paenibacillus sp. 1_12]SFM35278.1 hypothetical protein SAMN03159341_1282 [Paenibacillus sp. 1_12]